MNQTWDLNNPDGIDRPLNKPNLLIMHGLGDRGSITGRVIQNAQKMLLDTSMLNTQCYMIRIEAKLSNPGKGIAPLHLSVVAIDQGVLGSLRLRLLLYRNT